MRAITVCFLLTWGVAACGSADQSPPGLRLAIQAYYLAESEQDWTTTWNLRTSDFRRIQPFEAYRTQMALDSEGWAFGGYRIVAVEMVEDASALVHIEFVENPPPAARAALGIPSGVATVTFKERTEWAKEGETWRCKVCGTRSHLVMNSSP